MRDHVKGAHEEVAEQHPVTMQPTPASESFCSSVPFLALRVMMKGPAHLWGMPPSTWHQGTEGPVPHGRETGSPLLTTFRYQEQRGTPVCQVRQAEQSELCEQTTNHPNALWWKEVTSVLSPWGWGLSARGSGPEEPVLLRAGYSRPEALSQGCLCMNCSDKLFSWALHADVESTHRNRQGTGLTAATGQPRCQTGEHWGASPWSHHCQLFVNLGLSNNKSSQNTSKLRPAG